MVIASRMGPNSTLDPQIKLKEPVRSEISVLVERIGADDPTLERKIRLRGTLWSARSILGEHFGAEGPS